MDDDLIARYRNDEHAAVWAEVLSWGDVAGSPERRAESLGVARNAMMRVRGNIEQLIPRLDKIGYQFGYSAERKAADYYLGPLVTPARDTKEQLEYLQSITGPWPVSVVAWYEVVGSVDFRGYCPGWRLDYTDPLVVDPLDVEYVEAEHQEWLESKEGGDPWAAQNFALDLAPDMLHKANVSGSTPYGIALPDGATDALLLNERHKALFVDYLRIAFSWGGFPGWELVPEEDRPDADLKALSEGLLSF